MICPHTEDTIGHTIEDEHVSKMGEVDTMSMHRGLFNPGKSKVAIKDKFDWAGDRIHFLMRCLPMLGSETYNELSSSNASSRQETLATIVCP